MTLDLPGRPHPAVLAAFIEAIATSNALWYLQQWRDGKDPACCCKCAGVLYEPEKVSAGTWCVALPRAFELDSASCHTATAVHVGHKRAKDIRDGLPMNTARARHCVELHQSGPAYWHAFYRGPDGLEDVTTKMEPVL